ncbi:hypothetical protein [Gloeocapsopsis dulcis]|uniref:Primosomal protein n=1 Tax=Gloeocapsopsis dulcis AAB1 = 1H9 TaxID=1433147 RepID=A0A6N8FP09_9CHRO|nr:hypothetical protein [Gloeocapsopsis dulcis]MUL35118.1 hypothetical protein [Gloeocapsopsis dulcis AAB1 = 1H9]WNN89000.1 hypothetical protein P0S91_22535 [Gloeocapsopsis dulcis]
MATIEQIKREIAALEEACRVLAEELYAAYTNYFLALGQAVRQQAILATYHLCTQGYPEAFLSLSFSQRQQLQQDVRKVIRKAIEQLLAITQVEEKENLEEDIKEDLKLEATEEALLESVSSHPSSSSTLLKFPANPIDLIKWQQNIEQAIALQLKTISREINYLLQQAKILPEKLPFPLLDAALNTPELPAEATAGPPNLLNLLVEAESNSNQEESSVTTLVAVYLRLGEIEFADTTLRAKRNQIRHLETRIRTLLKEYYKKQREQAIAEAEAAWRASWFED